jgi:hypothetical protein
MYDFDICYQAASSNALADLLSRFPVDEPEVTSAWMEHRGKRSQLLHLRLSDISVSKKQLKQTTVNDKILIVSCFGVHGLRLAKQCRKPADRVAYVFREAK